MQTFARRYKASQWKDGSWDLVYHVVSISGVEQVITGEMVDCGAGSSLNETALPAPCVLSLAPGASPLGDNQGN